VRRSSAPTMPSPGAPISSPNIATSCTATYTRAARPDVHFLDRLRRHSHRDLPGAGRVLGGLHRTFVEDMELGVRMRQQGREIWLDKVFASSISRG